MEQQLTHTYVTKLWGSERWMVNNELYCAKILTLYQDTMCSIHYHKIKNETFVLQHGEILLQFFDNLDEIVSREYHMRPGDTIQIPPLTAHRFIGLQPMSEILEISTQHFDEDSYRIKNAGYLVNGKYSETRL